MRRLLLFAFVAVIAACSTIDCPVQNKVAVNYAVKTIVDGVEVKDTLTDTLYVWSTRSDNKDTLILNRGIGISSFSLPVSYTHPEDKLVFCLVDTNDVSTVDTVWLKKEDIPHFESVDCSAHFFHTLTAIRSTHKAIDTIFINNPKVNYDSSLDHIHVHFKK
ncbi:DUF6452 family protein [Prevotella sp. E2-28]|uniref:DUF6452 family protein n=1 Tax=Prevotella sp. E2-28 TaxID=2913620 RepID=UPI001EDA739F|nr:DUF6452 family protein [Prevotella sp. E2-28]UKK53406.1 DUF6452 family protein [Prevotella sp. E2-28]